MGDLGSLKIFTNITLNAVFYTIIRHMKHYTYIIPLLMVLPVVANAAPQQIVKDCWGKHSSYAKAAVCVQEYENIQTQKRYSDLRAFLKENPRYRWPAQSINKCFSKPKRLLLEKIEQKSNGDGSYIFPRYAKTCEDS